MDTKSTNSKAYILTKIIAVLLAVVTLGYSAVNITKAYIRYERQSMSYFRLWDAVSNYDDKNAVYSSYIFENKMEGYLFNLAQLVYYYQDGSKEAYESIVKDEDYEELKKKLLYNILYRSNSNDETAIKELLALSDENVITMNLVKAKENDGYEEPYCVEFYSSFDADDVVDDYTSGAYYSAAWIHSQELEEALKTDADILIDLEDWEFSYDGEEYFDGIKAGQYAVKVNDAKLKDILMAIDKMSFLTYEQFREEYKQKKTSFEARYTGINYIYKDKNGKIISNVKNDKEVYYGEYDYILSGESDALKDLYGNIYYIDYYGYDNIWAEKSNHFVTTHVISTVPESPTSAPSQDSNGEEITLAVTTTEPTTIYPTEKPTASSYSEKIKISELKNDSLCIFFDRNASFSSMTIHEMDKEVSYANELLFSMFRYIAIAVLGFMAALIILLILCGRKRKGAEEVTFPFSDRIFFEFKTVLNIGLGFGVFMLGVNGVDIFSDKGMDKMALAVSAVCLPVIGLFLIDYILYIARHLKAKNFLKSFFVVWFVKVLCANSFKVLKKLRTAAGKVIKTFFEIIFFPLKKLKEALNSEKLYYAKSVEQTVKIKTAILIAVNVPFALLCFLCIFLFEGIDEFSELFLLFICAVPAVACDALALIRGLSFVGGVSRIAEVISEYRKGNLDTPINRAGLPSYLIPVGENLESLGEGIKLAVDEAVKQESTKTELITNISHDLKTPLTSIINYVDLLKKCNITDETAVSYLEVLGEKSDRLKILITDLVEASKAATGNVEVNITSISLREILNQLAGEFSDVFAKRNLDVILSVPDEDIVVSADNKLLYRVLENLAVNIEKYSMAGTRVYISAECRERKGIITFKNISKDPLNITPDELKQRFVRGDASRTTEGNGLGLSIAENLCIVQQGNLDIDIVGDLFIAKVILNCR